MSETEAQNVASSVASGGDPGVELKADSAVEVDGPVVPLEDLYCPSCGYDLRATAGRRCPECGNDLGFLYTPEISIPWEHRRTIGRVRAYLRTVWMVSFRHRRFCENYAKRLDYRSARRFQLVTVSLAWMPIVIAAAALYGLLKEAVKPGQSGGFMAGFMRPQPAFLELAVNDVWPMGLLLGGLLLWLIAVTGVQSYFFHPKGLAVRRQNAAVAMSYYCCGLPVLFFLIPGILVAISVKENFLSGLLWVEDPVVFCVAFFAAVVVPATLADWWLCSIRTLRRTMPQFPRRRLMLALFVPPIWLGLAVVCLLVLPLAVVYVLVVVASFVA